VSKALLVNHAPGFDSPGDFTKSISMEETKEDPEF